jgi:hypothetical protein
LCFGAASLAVVALLVIAFPTVAQKCKAFQARRLARQAMVLIDNKEWALADRKVRDAMSIRPSEPEVCLAVARLLSRGGTGQAASAIDWWRNIGPTITLTPADHRDYAAMALAISDLETATREVGLLMSKPAPLPQDLLLAGQLALARGLTDSGLRYGEKALSDSRATSQDAVSAAALVFQTDSLDSPGRAEACARLASVARDPSDPAALDALALLAKQPLTSNPPASIFSTPLVNLCSGAITFDEIAGLLENHQKARGRDRILACDIRVRIDPSRADELVAKAVTSFGNADDDTLIALGAWLHSLHRFDEELKVVTADRANNRRELMIERVSALTSLNRVAEAEELLLGESSVIDETSQHMYLAVVKSRRQGEAIGSSNEWERALDSAGTTQALLTLADYAERNGALGIADAAYDRVVTKQSNLRSAYVAHLRLAEAMDQTEKARTIALKITQLWPNDVTSRMHEAYLSLLLGASEEETKTAEDDARAVLRANPWNVGARMVLALAQLKQGRNADALDAVSESRTNRLPNSNRPMAVRAAALNANGWKDKAAEEAQKLAAVKLLPEERALISPLLSRVD